MGNNGSFNPRSHTSWHCSSSFTDLATLFFSNAFCDDPCHIPKRDRHENFSGYSMRWMNGFCRHQGLVRFFSACCNNYMQKQRMLWHFTNIIHLETILVLRFLMFLTCSINSLSSSFIHNQPRFFTGFQCIPEPTWKFTEWLQLSTGVIGDRPPNLDYQLGILGLHQGIGWLILDTTPEMKTPKPRVRIEWKWRKNDHINHLVSGSYNWQWYIYVHV